VQVPREKLYVNPAAGDQAPPSSSDSGIENVSVLPPAPLPAATCHVVAVSHAPWKAPASLGPASGPVPLVGYCEAVLPTHAAAIAALQVAARTTHARRLSPIPTGDTWVRA
jgi:hypothetical protein